MMKIFKLLTLLILVTVLCFTVISCNNNAEENKQIDLLIPSDEIITSTDLSDVKFDRFELSFFNYVKENSTDSFVVSPLDFKTMMGLVCESSEGNTLDQIVSSMGYIVKEDLYSRASIINGFIAQFNQSGKNKINRYSCIYQSSSDYSEISSDYVSIVKQYFGTVFVKDNPDKFDAFAEKNFPINSKSVKDTVKTINSPLILTDFSLDAKWKIISGETYYGKTKTSNVLVLKFENGLCGAFINGETDDVESLIKSAEKTTVYGKLLILSLYSAFDSDTIKSFLNRQGMNDLLKNTSETGKMFKTETDKHISDFYHFSHFEFRVDNFESDKNSDNVFYMETSTEFIIFTTVENTTEILFAGVI